MECNREEQTGRARVAVARSLVAPSCVEDHCCGIHGKRSACELSERSTSASDLMQQLNTERSIREVEVEHVAQTERDSVGVASYIEFGHPSEGESVSLRLYSAANNEQMLCDV